MSTIEQKIKEISVHNDEEIKGFFKSYRWLSNMYSCDILWHNLHFKSVEAAYQASKFNLEIAKKFTNYDAKTAKKESKNYTVRKDWDKMKYNIMAQLVFQKFLVHKELRDKLCWTKEAYLEETNYWNDTYWGVCNGKGENNLGKILMDTRKYFYSEFEYHGALSAFQDDWR